MLGAKQENSAVADQVHILDTLSPEELEDLKQIILRWIDRRGSAAGSLPDPRAAAGDVQRLHEYLSEIEDRLAK